MAPIALLSGPLFFATLLFLPPPESLSLHGWYVVAVGGWMLLWWVFEAVPIAVTALLPLLLLPVLNVATMRDVGAHYGHPIIFLFFGGFILATALSKWGLHKRIALSIIRLTGTNTQAIIGGFMAATAFLSMWISNTATTVMMLPIAASILTIIMRNEEEECSKAQRYFSLSLLLGIAYAANIGGTATLIGTPPNAILAGFFEERYAITIHFADWAKIAVPFMISFLFIAWLLLTKIIYPSTINTQKTQIFIDQEWQALGRMGRDEISVLIVFSCTALAWMFKGFTALASFSDTGIALMAVIAFFVVPSSKSTPLLCWQDTKELPWGILLLFGGGLSLASAASSTGLVGLLGGLFHDIAPLGIALLLLVIIVSVLFLTEIMSNMALITIILPVLAVLATHLDVEPLLFASGATLASSCAFMLPMATPPNALVFATGHMHIRDMIRAGIVMNLVAVLLVFLVVKWGIGGA